MLPGDELPAGRQNMPGGADRHRLATGECGCVTKLTDYDQESGHT